MLKEREISLSRWIENMRKDTSPGDNICLYLLARMYNKHVYVHNKIFYWCMAIHIIKSKVDLELINDCEIELVFVHPWVFGEEKKVRRPKGTLPSTSTMTPKPAKTDTGITENIKVDQTQETKDCMVTLTRIKGVQVNNLPKPPAKETGQMRCTRRKRTVTDYNKLINYDEDDDISIKLQTLTQKAKKMTNQLIAKAIQNQTKNREKQKK